MQALWQELLDFAQTPAGLLILAAAAFVLASFLITGLIFFIASLFKKKSPLAVQPSEDALQEKTPEETSGSAGDPLESFDRRSLKAPIALARLRAQGPDITEAAEPMMPGSAPQPAVPERNLKEEEKPLPEPVAASAPASEPAPEPPQPAPFASAPITPKLPDPFGRANFLLTLPFERRVGLSMAHADLCGAGIEAVFFDPEAVSRWDDVTLRLVPFLPQGSGKLLITESDRETFSSGDLFAQPDAVIELSSGLIALEYKSKGGRSEDPLRWAEAMRTKDILQTVINALVLSAEAGARRHRFFARTMRFSSSVRPWIFARLLKRSSGMRSSFSRFRRAAVVQPASVRPTMPSFSRPSFQSFFRDRCRPVRSSA